MSERAWKVREAASRLDLSERAVREKADSGELPAYRIGKRWRFDPVVLQRFIEAGGTPRASNARKEGEE